MQTLLVPRLAVTREASRITSAVRADVRDVTCTELKPISLCCNLYLYLACITPTRVSRREKHYTYPATWVETARDEVSADAGAAPGHPLAHPMIEKQCASTPSPSCPSRLLSPKRLSKRHSSRPLLLLPPFLPRSSALGAAIAPRVPAPGVGSDSGRQAGGGRRREGGTDGGQPGGRGGAAGEPAGGGAGPAPGRPRPGGRWRRGWRGAGALQGPAGGPGQGLLGGGGCRPRSRRRGDRCGPPRPVLPPPPPLLPERNVDMV